MNLPPHPTTNIHRRFENGDEIDSPPECANPGTRKLRKMGNRIFTAELPTERTTEQKEQEHGSTLGITWFPAPFTAPFPVLL